LQWIRFKTGVENLGSITFDAECVSR